MPDKTAECSAGSNSCMFGMQDGRTDQSRPSRLLPGYGKPLGEILGWSPTPGGSSTNSDELGIIPSRLAFFFSAGPPGIPV